MSLNSNEIPNSIQIKFFGQKTILSDFQIDSRKVKQNSVFVALEGTQVDGHKFIEKAFQSGASTCVVSENWFNENGQNFLGKNFMVGKTSLSALQELAKIYRSQLTTKIIGLTGSNGKTTTKDLLFEVLSQKFKTYKTPGNFNNHIGLPLAILGIPKETEIAVIEMGANHVGEIAELCEIAQPEFGLITNVGRSHIGEFGSEENILKAKTELFRWLDKCSGKAFVNSDDLRLIDLSPENPITYGIKRKPNFLGIVHKLSTSSTPIFSVNNSKEIHLKTFGEHNIFNSLSAFAVGREFGISEEKIISVLENFDGVSGRFGIKKINGVNFIDDSYNSNPESTFAGLETLSKFPSGKKIAVLGEMLELGEFSQELHAEVGRKAKELKIDLVLTFGKNAKFIAENFNGFHFDSKEKLVKKLREEVSEGDFVLVKGSRGMKMEEVINQMQNKEN
ncbi:MAG: UDP-N-acetylmuramoyl-tripeptide--D-alanyl-D-alanine ligase [Calditrichaeota bacterium]|nr:MAG: UDP-N-acetylmuramoyl-tripeptide--D-alanyl-D-alanine ligase [Calditrichota bacterium]